MKAFYIVDTLLNVKYNGNVPSCKLRRGPPMTIKQFGYDHLQQKITVRDMQPWIREHPRLLSFAENKDFLRTHFPNWLSAASHFVV
jgi:hypothetical protein